MISDEEIQATYNRTNKDMPYAEFRKAMIDLTNPTKMRQDMVAMMQTKHLSQQARIKSKRVGSPT